MKMETSKLTTKEAENGALSKSENTTPNKTSNKSVKGNKSKRSPLGDITIEVKPVGPGETGLAQAIFEILSHNYATSPWTLTQIEEDMLQAGSGYFLARNTENELVAFMATLKIIDEIEITNLAVLPVYQRQGIALRLLKQLDQEKAQLFLEVRAGNQAAISLYEKQGFKVFNRRRAYYTNPVEDALLMKKEQMNER